MPPYQSIKLSLRLHRWFLPNRRLRHFPKHPSRESRFAREMLCWKMLLAINKRVKPLELNCVASRLENSLVSLVPLSISTSLCFLIAQTQDVSSFCPRCRTLTLVSCPFLSFSSTCRCFCCASSSSSFNAELRAAFELHRSRVLGIKRNCLTRLFEILSISLDTTDLEDLDIIRREEWPTYMYGAPSRPHKK
jgi:hypothetical protein